MHALGVQGTEVHPVPEPRGRAVCPRWPSSKEGRDPMPTVSAPRGAGLCSVPSPASRRWGKRRQNIRSGVPASPSSLGAAPGIRNSTMNGRSTCLAVCWDSDSPRPSPHSLLLLFPDFSQEFLKFATMEAIQRTEIFEYCQMLGRPKSFIPPFQVTKAKPHKPPAWPCQMAVSSWVSALLCGT